MRGGARRLPWRGAASLALGLSLAPVTPSPAQGAGTDAERLVRTYAPIVMMRAQEDPPCDSAEEQFRPPTSVDLVLGDPAVRLRVKDDNTDTERTISRAPTSADLAKLGENAFLDLPGRPASAGCRYARHFEDLRRRGRAPPVTYAHVARQADHRGLAVQYWFFYYFNEFNDVHEGDWEGMQLTFSGDTPRQALRTGPDEVVVFQHAGGEKAAWDAEKVEKQGTHPVVYAAAGSHATFYGSSLYLGNGKRGAGLGCDNTTEPLVRVRPRPVLVPTDPPVDGPYAWLTYRGRWGEREPGYNDGPTGPNTKTQWRAPFDWIEDVRSTSPRIPGGTVLGPAVTGGFCEVVAQASSFVNLATSTRVGAAVLALGLLLAVLVPVALTRWRPVEVEPLRGRRAFGQILAASARLYGRHAGALLLLGLTALGLMATVTAILWGLRPLLGAGVTGPVESADTQFALSTSLSGIVRPISAAAAGAVIVAYLHGLALGRPTGVPGAWRAMLHRFGRLVGVQLLVPVLVVLLALTIVGLPWAVKKYVDWQFVQQEAAFEDRGVRAVLRGSTDAVRGRWWPTAWRVAVLSLLAQIPGPLLGIAFLFTEAPLTLVNLFGSLVFALILPYLVAARTLIYLDLRARGEAPERVPARAPAPAPAPG